MTSSGARPIRAGSVAVAAQARTTASASRSLSAASSLETTMTAAAASFMPLALPAVMEKSSISGWSGLSEASFSRVVPRRGCSSVSKVTVVPSAWRAWTGTISSLNAPASMAATARWWERNAQASISSRVRPTSLAVFQPTEIDMSMLGASGVSGCVGGIQRSVNWSSVPGVRNCCNGEVEVDWVPPAMIARSAPERIWAAALPIAVRPPAQCRLIAWPGTWVMPVTTAACRAMSPPP